MLGNHQTNLGYLFWIIYLLLLQIHCNYIPYMLVLILMISTAK